MDKGVKCPNTQCSEKFVWDWCQDIYETVKEHKNCNETITDNDFEEIITYTCPSCGCTLTTIVYNKITDLEEWIINPNEEWIAADWEEHAAD
jgi:hypothetical protein